MDPKIAVIIPTFNVSRIKNIFKKCLDNTLNLKYDNYEVVVVNNGSTDNTLEILKDYEKEIKIINLKENVGFANANNIAYEKTKSDFVLLLNQDAIPEQDSLKELVKVANDEKIGAVGGIQVDYSKRRITALGSLRDVYGTWIDFEFPKINEVKESYYTYIPASFLLVKRKAVGNILFPKEFFMYWEDVELCMRLWSNGYRVKLIPTIACAHEFRTSPKKVIRRNHSFLRRLNYSFIKNWVLLTTTEKKYNLRIFTYTLLKNTLLSPISETFHLPIFLYLYWIKNHNYPSRYYPFASFVYFVYAMKRLSTIDLYGPNYPLSLKTKDSFKKFLDLRGTIFYKFGRLTLNYDDTIVTNSEIENCKYNFIIEK